MMDNFSIEGSGERRRHGQDGEASRSNSQNQFPGSTAFHYPHQVSSGLGSQRWRASPAQAAFSQAPTEDHHD